jgi:uncharacterized protein YabE (DUF348 family)
MQSQPTVEPPKNALPRRWKSRVRWLSIPFILGLFSLMTVGYLNSFTPIKIVDGDRIIDLRTHQTNVEGVLREANIDLLPEDVVLPAGDAVLRRNDTVIVKRARLVKLRIDGDEPRLIRTQRDSGSQVLKDLGLAASVEDAVVVNGAFSDVLTLPALTMKASSNTSQAVTELELRRALPISIMEGAAQPLQIKTTARTVGEALLQAGVMIYLADRVSPAPGERITPDMQISIERAKPVTIWVDGRQVRTRTLSDKVSDVLAEMNIVLFEQDYARPDLNATIEPDNEVRVVRIRREVAIQQEYIPFETLWQADPEMELDTQVLAQDGAPGVREQRSLVTYEDGLEVKRELTSDFVARDPQPRIYKYGTKVVLRTIDTPQGPVQYWRKIRMLATSYSASTAGVSRDKAWYGKARCGVTMRFGIVAVDPRVISLGSNVFVPDYGVGSACDTGSAIKGKRIDLGYDDSNLKLWYRWVEVYLLAPAPANIQYRLE